MSSLPRALAASAALHVGVLALFALVPEPRPHRDAAIDVQIVMLPAGGDEGAGEGGGEPSGAGTTAGEASVVDGGAGAGTESTAARGRQAQIDGAANTDEAGAPAPASAASTTAVAAAAPDSLAAVEVDGDVPGDMGSHSATVGASSGSSSGSSDHDGDRQDNGSVGSDDHGSRNRDGDLVYGTGDGNGSGDGDGSGDGSGDGDGDGDGSLRQQLAWQTARCYPRAARRRRTEGLVEVRFCLDDSGHPHTTEILRSSGSDVLDEAATGCVIPSSSPFALRDLCITVPIDFRLR